jgi:hypothetical protein
MMFYYYICNKCFSSPFKPITLDALVVKGRVVAGLCSETLRDFELAEEPCTMPSVLRSSNGRTRACPQILRMARFGGPGSRPSTRPVRSATAVYRASRRIKVAKIQRPPKANFDRSLLGIAGGKQARAPNMVLNANSIRQCVDRIGKSQFERGA